MIRLPLNANRDLSSRFTDNLVGRRLDLGSDEIHPYTALSACWRKVRGPAAEVVGHLRNLQAAAEDNFEPEPALRSLKALIYSATEVFDFYQSIQKLMEAGRSTAEKNLIRDYAAGVKRLRSPIALMCNRMKHNYREMVAAKFVSEATGQATFVYRINAVYEGVQQADRDVHRTGSFASIERTVHEIIHGLLRADFRAGELVRALPDRDEPVIHLRGMPSLGMAEVLINLGTRTPTVAASESNRFDGIAVEEDDILITRVTAHKIPEPTRRQMHATADEVARTLHLIV